MGRNFEYDSRVLAKNWETSNNPSVTNRNSNILICGGSGSGKTGSVLYYTLKNLNNESAIIADSKGVLSGMFSDTLKERGYDVIKISMLDPEKNITGYNPLRFVRRDSEGRIREEDIVNIAEIICPNSNSGEPFWEIAAQNVISFLIAYIMEACGEEEQTMCNVYRLYRKLVQRDGHMAFLEWTEKHPDSYSACKLDEVMAFQAANRTRDCIYAFVGVALRSLSMNSAKHIFEKTDNIDFLTLGKRKTCVFLEISDVSHSFDTCINLFYAQALATLVFEANTNPGGRLNIPVQLWFDDFGANSIIPDFEKTISVIRSRQISVGLLVQSFSQIESMYGRNKSTTIINNCDTMVYMSSNDYETASFIATRCNKPIEDIMNMPRNKVWILCSGMPAKLADKLEPYGDYEVNAEVEV